MLLAIAVLLALLLAALGVASAAVVRADDGIRRGTPRVGIVSTVGSVAAERNRVVAGRLADVTGTMTTGGPAVTLSVSTVGDRIVLSFEGTAGQRVSYLVNDTSIFNASYSILNPDGSTLLSGGWNRWGGWYMDVRALPQSGTYQIVIDPSGSYLGSVTSTLYDVPADLDGTIAADGQPVTQTISAPGQNAGLTFSGTAGQRVSYLVDNPSVFNASYSILNPDGSTLLSGGWNRWGGLYMDVRTLAQSGTYRILFDPSGSYTGSIVSRLYTVPLDDPESIVSGAPPVAVSLPIPGQRKRFTFGGAAGDTATVTTSNVGIFNATVSILRPDDTVLASKGWNRWGGATVSATLPAAGTYTILVDPTAAYTGTLNLQLGQQESAVPPAQMFGTFCGPGSLAAVACGMLSDPVNTLTGTFVHAETDLAMSATGVPLEWTRTYTSADTASGRLGPGWTDTYQASLEVQPGGDVVAKGDEGQRLVFTADGSGGFDGAPGARATLENVAGGYRLTSNDQLVYLFDASGKLLSKKDRNGQGVTLAYDGSGRLATVTDSAGHTATVSYNASNLVGGVSLSDGRSVSYGYTSGRLTSFTDVRGKTWQYAYETGGRLTTITDPLGHIQVTNVYDQASGRVTSQKDATNKTTTFAWDAATQTATVTDPRNHVWKDVYVDGVLSKRIDATNNTTQLGFDGDLNGTSVKSPLGETTTMAYDANGNLLTVTAPASLSAEKTFVYNARNDPTTVTDARGTVTSYTYTQGGNVETVTQGGEQQAAYAYDAQDRVETATDANGNTTSYTYDTAGNVASVTQPDPDGPGPLGQPVTTFTYDSQGNVLTRVEPKGNVVGCGCAAQYTTTFTYNPAGQLLTETDPLGHVTTTNVYDDAGRLSSTTDANVHTTSFTYDNANRLLTETSPDPDGAGSLTAPVTTYTYDAAGNELTETDPRGGTTTYAYDNANRLISVTQPDPDGAGAQPAPKTTYTYDANGELASMVEPRGNVSGANPDGYRTTYTYDAAGRMLTTTDPLGHATTNAYDDVGELASVTDANGHATAYTYDYAGRVRTVTAPDPDGAGPLPAPVTTYTYDPAGNQLTVTGANGHTTSRAYDALNRPVSETSPDPDGAGADTPSATTTTYDLNSNLVSTTDPNGNGTPTAGDGTTTYAYDRANRLTGIDYSDATPDVTFTLDNVGNRLTMTDGAGTETRAYDNLDRLLSVTRSGTGFGYAYDAASNVTRRTYPDGTTVDYTYDPLERMSTTVSGGLTTAYAYDAASNLLTRTLPATNGHVETRTYDHAGRLNEVANAKGATVLADITWTRDPVGNPLTETRTGTAPESKTFTYDNMDRITGVCFQAGTCPGGADPFIRWSYDGVGNRLTEQRPTGTTNYSYDAIDRMLAAGGTSYTYDRNGNQLAAGASSFSYDLANRVTSATVAGTVTTYSYDGDGKRLRAAGGAQETNFAWDVTYGLPQLVLERDGGNALLRRYVYGNQPISMATSDTALHYYHYDPLGSVRDITDAAGTSEATYDYEPFGAIRTQTGTLDQPLRFTGQYQDPTGLYHMRARQYDPTTGRFLSIDPADQTVGGSAISAYSYVAGRVTTMIDPAGTWSTLAVSERSLAFTGTASSRASSICRVGLVLLWCGGFTASPDGDVIDRPRPIPFPEASSTTKGGLALAIAMAVESCRRSNCEHDPTKRQLHHIVAKRAVPAEPARVVLRRANVGLEEKVNKVDLPAWFHQRLHTSKEGGSYYRSVNRLVANAARGLVQPQLGDAVRRQLVEIGWALRAEVVPVA